MKTSVPGGVGIKGNLFGLAKPKKPDLMILPVPWEVTVSYGGGTSEAPRSVLNASSQLDHSIYSIKKPWNYKVGFDEYPADLHLLSDDKRKLASKVIRDLESGSKTDFEAIQKINSCCEEMVAHVYDRSVIHLDNNLLCGVLGGDHSTPLGLIQALGERYQFGILQIDAHMDLRESYEGFNYSHASIMYNAIQLGGVQSIVQVGIRDYAPEEEKFIRHSDKPIQVFHDDHIKSGLMVGDSWSDWVYSILAMLPENVYVSFDIDGLMPNLCPNTGTPVPGGLSFEQTSYLLAKLAQSGRRIIGFDLCEVGVGDEWDLNVAARILYRLSVFMGVTQGKVKMNL